MAFLGKLYSHDRDENYEPYIESLGLPADRVANLKNYKPQQKLEKNGDTYTMTAVSAAGDRTISFKVGEEFDENLAEGHNAKTTFTLDGNTLTQTQKFADDTDKNKLGWYCSQILQSLSLR
ncbi:PREDICTED: fatty acid-binding protein-like isoform X2 [Papilio polytes]|uniref:fatty acid-binding protein-like isoform X2 n=1 Tax=Papilio polytes TaxID=76194 RepID=UPI000675EF43|nr:PREDICTED: fatty acid-binding protein-like isoform X2 [Papilio polytes]